MHCWWQNLQNELQLWNSKFPIWSLIDYQYSRTDLHAARFRTGSNEFTIHSFDVQWPRLDWHFRPTPSGGLSKKQSVPEPISCGFRTIIRALCWNDWFRKGEQKRSDREWLSNRKREWNAIESPILLRIKIKFHRNPAITLSGFQRYETDWIKQSAKLNANLASRETAE